MNILQKIFTDHYEEIKYTLHPRKTEIENIDKMINCGDSSFGGAMYGWLMSHIAIVFSQSMKIFANPFSRIVLCSIVCSTL